MVVRLALFLVLVVILLSLLEQWRGGQRNAGATNSLSYDKEILEDEARIIPGLGEGGVAVHLLGPEKKLGEESEKKLAINAYLSDRIPYNRTLKASDLNPEQERRISKLRGPRRISRSLLSFADGRRDDGGTPDNGTARRHMHKSKHNTRHGRKPKHGSKRRTKNKFVLKLVRTLMNGIEEHLEVVVHCKHQQLFPNNTFVRDIVTILNENNIKVINNGHVFERNKVTDLDAHRPQSTRVLKKLDNEGAPALPAALQQLKGHEKPRLPGSLAQNLHTRMPATMPLKDSPAERYRPRPRDSETDENSDNGQKSSTEGGSPAKALDQGSRRAQEAAPVKLVMRSNLTFNLDDEIFSWKSQATDDLVYDLLEELVIASNDTEPPENNDNQPHFNDIQQVSDEKTHADDTQTRADDLQAPSNDNLLGVDDIQAQSIRADETPIRSDFENKAVRSEGTRDRLDSDVATDSSQIYVQKVAPESQQESPKDEPVDVRNEIQSSRSSESSRK